MTQGFPKRQLSFVFEGCSWGCCYYLGVYKAILAHYTAEELSTARFGGSSSGTLAALGCCLGKSVAECLSMYTELAHCGKEFGVFGLMSVFHEIVLRRWLPQGGNEYLRLKGRLFVNVTRFVAVSDVLSDWQSNDEIVNAMHGSMHIPFYMTWIKPVRGSMGLDGGLSANIFRIDDGTITVSAATRKGDICPKVLVSLAECFAPPTKERMEAIFSDGANVNLADTLAQINGNTSVEVDEMMPKVKKTSSLFRKGKIILLRYSLCSIFWTLRVLEERPWTYFSITAAAAMASYMYPHYIRALARRVWCEGAAS
jgi:hypothetical protein